MTASRVGAQGRNLSVGGASERRGGVEVESGAGKAWGPPLRRCRTRAARQADRRRSGTGAPPAALRPGGVLRGRATCGAVARERGSILSTAVRGLSGRRPGFAYRCRPLGGGRRRPGQEPLGKHVKEVAEGLSVGRNRGRGGPVHARSLARFGSALAAHAASGRSGAAARCRPQRRGNRPARAALQRHQPHASEGVAPATGSYVAGRRRCAAGPAHARATLAAGNANGLQSDEPTRRWAGDLGRAMSEPACTGICELQGRWHER